MIHPANNTSASDQPSFRYRPLLIVLFAIILLLVSGKANADEAYGASGMTQAKVQQTQASDAKASRTTVQLNGKTYVVPKATILPAVMISNVDDQVHAVRDRNLIARSRPKYVELDASLANFDADADPDGWRAKVVLRDGNDRPVVMRARATFTLMPRLPTADFHAFVDADTKSMTWSKDVSFDAEGVAHFKLPLRQSLQPMLVYARSTHRNGLFGTRRTPVQNGSSRTVGQRQRLSTLKTRRHLGMANVGELQVRLSVPTEGVFEASLPIQVRPSVLVDTHWPYR